MEESDKLPLKRVELSLSKFNEVAIPHHLDLLRQHKINIVKYSAEGSLSRVQSEQAHARRVAQRLRALLSELDALRRRVRPEDLPEFDRRTQRARDNTLKAIVDYLDTAGAALESGGAAPVGSLTSAASVGLVDDEPEPPPDDDRLQLVVDHQELELREREACLRGWTELAADVRALHEAWQSVQAAALHQRALCDHSAGAVQLAAGRVHEARAALSSAERLRAGALVCGGAALGALAGGPVGLVVGLKAGAAAALAGSLLGAVGVRALVARPAAVDPYLQLDDHKDGDHKPADHKNGDQKPDDHKPDDHKDGDKDKTE